MADAPAPSSGGFSTRMTRKVGPLPVWAWAIIALVAGYYLYKRFGGSSSSSAATGTTPASASTPIPNGDQSGGGVGSASGSSGTTTPTAPPLGPNPPSTTDVIPTDILVPPSLGRTTTPISSGGSLDGRVTTPVFDGGSFYSPGTGTPNTGGSVKVSGGRLTA